MLYGLFLAPSCTVAPGGNLFYDQNHIYPWTAVSRTYTANRTDPLLVFTQAGGGNDYYLLNSPSIVDTTSPSGELLDNPGFNNATNVFAGWNLWCLSSCTGTKQTQAAVVNSTYRPGGTDNSASLNCGTGKTTYFSLAQSFTATLGHLHNVSFWLHYSGGGGAYFYVDIY